MVLYTYIISFFVVLISLLNALLGSYASFLEPFLWTLLAVAISILIDGLCALCVRWFSDKHFNTEAKFFKERKNERQHYENLKIRKWKDKIPELGKAFNYFDKTKMEKNPTCEYISTFIMETVRGEITHILSMFMALILLIAMPFRLILCISLPVTIINILLQIPSIFVLRYTRFKLVVAHKHLKIRNERKEQSIVFEKPVENKIKTEKKEEEQKNNKTLLETDLLEVDKKNSETKK